MVKKWKTNSIIKDNDYKVFSVDIVNRTSPRTKVTQDFYKIESKDWLNIIAITTNKKIILIEQYRHGSNDVELEIPGGIVDTQTESPSVAALRELKEETGYSGSSAIEIGCVNPNPALFNNKCYTFLVLNAKLTSDQFLENTEDITVKLYPVQKLHELVETKKIKHGLVITAFYLYEKFMSKK